MKQSESKLANKAYRSMPKRLRVAMLAPCPFPTGQGTQVFIRQLASVLGSVDVEVELVTYGVAPDSSVPAASYFQHLKEIARFLGDVASFEDLCGAFDFKMWRAPWVGMHARSGPQWGKPWADVLLFATALKVCQNQSVDLIHAHNIEGLWIGLFLSQWLGIPLVYHAHNTMGEELPSYVLAPEEDTGPYMLRTARKVKYWGLKSLAANLGFALDLGARFADSVMVFDSKHQGWLQTHCHVQRDKIFVVPPGLDPQELLDLKRSHASKTTAERALPKIALPKGGPRLVYAGNLDGYQNLDILFAAWLQIQKQWPKARCVWASWSAPQQEKIDVWRKAGIHWVHLQSSMQLACVLEWGQIGLSARTHAYGVPIKVLNYLHAQCAVVACAQGVVALTQPKPAKLYCVRSDAASVAEGVLLAWKEINVSDEKLSALSGSEDGYCSAYDLQKQAMVYRDIYLQILGKERWQAPRRQETQGDILFEEAS